MATRSPSAPRESRSARRRIPPKLRQRLAKDLGWGRESAPRSRNRSVVHAYQGPCREDLEQDSWLRPIFRCVSFGAARRVEGLLRDWPEAALHRSGSDFPEWSVLAEALDRARWGQMLLFAGMGFRDANAALRSNCLRRRSPRSARAGSGALISSNSGCAGRARYPATSSPGSGDSSSDPSSSPTRRTTLPG